MGWVDAMPGGLSQGRTIKEVEENLKEAVQHISDCCGKLEPEGTPR